MNEKHLGMNDLTLETSKQKDVEISITVGLLPALNPNISSTKSLNHSAIQKSRKDLCNYTRSNRQNPTESIQRIHTNALFNEIAFGGSENHSELKNFYSKDDITYQNDLRNGFSFVDSKSSRISDGMTKHSTATKTNNLKPPHTVSSNESVASQSKEMLESTRKSISSFTKSTVDLNESVRDPNSVFSPESVVNLAKGNIQPIGKKISSFAKAKEFTKESEQSPNSVLSSDSVASQPSGKKKIISMDKSIDNSQDSIRDPNSVFSPESVVNLAKGNIQPIGKKISSFAKAKEFTKESEQSPNSVLSSDSVASQPSGKKKIISMDKSIDNSQDSIRDPNSVLSAESVANQQKGNIQIMRKRLSSFARAKEFTKESEQSPNSVLSSDSVASQPSGNKKKISMDKSIDNSQDSIRDPNSVLSAESVANQQKGNIQITRKRLSSFAKAKEFTKESEQSPNSVLSSDSVASQPSGKKKIISMDKSIDNSQDSIRDPNSVLSAESVANQQKGNIQIMRKRLSSFAKAKEFTKESEQSPNSVLSSDSVASQPRDKITTTRRKLSLLAQSAQNSNDSIRDPHSVLSAESVATPKKGNIKIMRKRLSSFAKSTKDSEQSPNSVLSSDSVASQPREKITTTRRKLSLLAQSAQNSNDSIRDPHSVLSAESVATPKKGNIQIMRKRLSLFTKPIESSAEYVSPNIGTRPEVLSPIIMQNRIISKNSQTKSSQTLSNEVVRKSEFDKLLSNTGQPNVEKFNSKDMFNVMRNHSLVSKKAKQKNEPGAAIASESTKESNSKNGNNSVISKKRWKASISNALFRVRCMKSIKKYGNIDSNSVEFMQELRKYDPEFTSKIKEIINKKEKTKSDLYSLESLLSSRMKGFSRYSMDQRLLLCQKLSYESYDMNRMILREGQKAFAFYFILSGKVDVFKLINNEIIPINQVNSGYTFGDRAMNSFNDKRTASVFSATEVELLKIDKLDYCDIVNSENLNGIAVRKEKLALIPHFPSSINGYLDKIALFVDISYYDLNETIVLENSRNFRINWIVKGTCKRLKAVPFVKRLISENHAGKIVKVLPYEDGMKLEANDQVYKEVLNIGELTDGEHFPELPELPDIYKETSFIDRAAYSSGEKCLNSGAFASIISKTKLIIASIDIADYFRLATNEMIIELLNARKNTIVPLSQIQNIFLEQRDWELQKKKVTCEIVNRSQY